MLVNCERHCCPSQAYLDLRQRHPIQQALLDTDRAQQDIADCRIIELVPSLGMRRQVILSA